MMSPACSRRIGVKVPGLWAMMQVLFAPAQLQRQAPQCGTVARPEQSLYQPTERLSPSRAMTIVFARTTAGAGAGAAAATRGAAFATGAGAGAGAAGGAATTGGAGTSTAKCRSPATKR